MSPARLAEGRYATAAHAVVEDRHEAGPESTPEELAMTDAPAIEEIARCPRCGYCGELNEFESLGLGDDALMCSECSYVGNMEQEKIGPSAGEERLF